MSFALRVLFGLALLLSASLAHAQEQRFTALLSELLTSGQMQRVGSALAPLVEATAWAS